MSADATGPTDSRVRRCLLYIGKFILHSVAQSSLGYFTVWEIASRSRDRQYDGSPVAWSEAERRAWVGIKRNFHRL